MYVCIIIHVIIFIIPYKKKKPSKNKKSQTKPKQSPLVSQVRT